MFDQINAALAYKIYLFKKKKKTLQIQLLYI